MGVGYMNASEELLEASLDTSHFEAVICEGVKVGICILQNGDDIVYAGYIKDCPDPTGGRLLLSRHDFVMLQDHVTRKRH